MWNEYSSAGIESIFKELTVAEILIYGETDDGKGVGFLKSVDYAQSASSDSGISSV
jgi:hypothetical protein